MYLFCYDVLKLIDNNKVNSVIDMLSPGAIFSLFNAFGYSKLGILLAIAQQIFHIDVAGMIEAIAEPIKESLLKGDKITDIPNNAPTYIHGLWLPVKTDIATAMVTISAMLKA